MSAPEKPDFTHGGEVYSLARAMNVSPSSLLDFSSNANIFARPLTQELLEKALPPFEHYPDSACAELIEAISLHESVETERILPGNGAADLIWLAIQSLSPGKVLCIGPIFSEFIKALRAFGIPYDIIPTSPDLAFTPGPCELEKIWASDADLVVMCTPNNPAAVTYDKLGSLFEMLRSPRVIIDNSYREFLYGSPDYAVNHFNAYHKYLRPGVSLFTLHSFTKFFCCPGIRLGYIMGDRAQLSRMAKLRPAWNIGSHAQYMGRVFLHNIEHYRLALQPLRDAVMDLGRHLRQLDCMHADHIFEGPGFLCCGLVPGRNAGQAFMKALESHIVIRNCDNIPGMPPGFIRLRARAPEDNDRLAKVLGNI